MKPAKSGSELPGKSNVTRWLQPLDGHVVHVNNLSHGTLTHTGRRNDIRQKHDRDAAEAPHLRETT